MTDLAQQAAALLHVPITRLSACAGGDLSQVWRAELADGRIVALKEGALVGTEARMLRAMERAGACVPKVLAISDRLIALEWLEAVPGGSKGWAALGQTLRQLHAATGKAPGWHEDYAFGRVAIVNAPTGHWPDFWAERRLLPALPDLEASLARRIERLATRLDELLPAPPRLALLHGDLWTGNVIFTQRGAAMIDPAAYYGHAEVDLAMLTLFGRPGRAFWSAYGTLEPGWEERRAVYQLWPALVHLRLFGAGYRGMVESLLDRIGVA